jgi:hypothetical protein
MKSLEFKAFLHNGIIEIPKGTVEIKDEEVKIIIVWDEKPVEESKKKKLKRFYEIIDAGTDISSFGDIKEWQRVTRADRNVNFGGI